MDPRPLNKYIKIQHFQITTQNVRYWKLDCYKYYTILDASVFLQVPLDEENSQLCTITTPFGRFRFTRVPYGLSCASKVF